MCDESWVELGARFRHELRDATGLYTTARTLRGRGANVSSPYGSLDGILAQTCSRLSATHARTFAPGTARADCTLALQDTNSHRALRS